MTRKFFKFAFSLMAIVLVSVSSFGQSTQELKRIINEIEKELQSVDLREYIYDDALKNREFFDKVDKIKSKGKISEVDKKELKEIAEKININSESIKKKKELILESYLKVVSQNSEFKLEITDFYINRISLSNMNMNIQTEIIKDLTFVQDLNIYLDTQNVTSGRSCVDQCMYDKLAALERSNWVEKAAFVLTAAQTTAIWFASCVWDCATN